MDFVNLENDLKKELVNTKSVLNGFLFIASGTNLTAAYVDPRYIPFYYHLSKYIEPKRVLEVGFTLGLLSGAFLRGSSSVKSFVGVYDGALSRLGKKNIQLVFKGDLVLTSDWNALKSDKFDKSDKWDLVIFDKLLPYDECRKFLDIVWDNLNLCGVLVYEHCLGEDNRAFVDFCKVHDREVKILGTRYGSGIVIR